MYLCSESGIIRCMGESIEPGSQIIDWNTRRQKKGLAKVEIDEGQRPFIELATNITKDPHIRDPFVDEETGDVFYYKKTDLSRS